MRKSNATWRKTKASAASTANAQLDNFSLAPIVAALRQSREVENNVRFRGSVRELPSREALLEVLKDLSEALFPTHFGSFDLTEDSIDFFVGHVLDRAIATLTEQVRRGLLVSNEAEEALSFTVAERASEIARALAERLPAIRSVLYRDIGAALAGDPAATSASEVLLSYPGFSAIMYHRFAHELFGLGAPLAARLISALAHSETGIDIHPGAQIGPGFFIDHGTGVVIGATTIIGANVRLYQAVTLGARRFETNADGSIAKGGARHPILEDDVVVYAGATLLGRITIGKRSVIGGNVWLTQSVPAGSVVTQARSRRSPNPQDGDELEAGPSDAGAAEPVAN